MWIIFIILWVVVVVAILRFFAVCSPRNVEPPVKTKEELIAEVINTLDRLDGDLWDYLMEHTDEFFEEEPDIDSVRNAVIQAIVGIQSYFRDTIGLSRPPTFPKEDK